MAESLNDFLKRYNKDFSTISKTLAKELLIVESEIIKRQQAISEAEELIRNNAINIKVIAEATNISRKTFYNNDLLNKYVMENSTIDRSAADEIKKLKSKLEEDKIVLLKFIHKDIDMEKLKIELSKTQNELQFAYKRITAFEKQHEQDLNEIKKMQKNLYN